MTILPAAPALIRNRDVEHVFRQDSDFYYLSGFIEPEAVIVLIPGRKKSPFVMFCRPRDPLKETWNGHRFGPEGAIEQFGADEAYPIDDMEDILPGLMEHCESVHYTIGLNTEFDKHVMACVNSLRRRTRGGVHVPYEFVSLDYLLLPLISEATHDGSSEEERSTSTMELMESEVERAWKRPWHRSRARLAAARQRALQRSRPWQRSRP